MRSARGNWNSGVMSLEHHAGAWEIRHGADLNLRVNSSWKILGWAFSGPIYSRRAEAARQRFAGASSLQLARQRGAQLDGVEMCTSNAFRFDQAVLLETGEDPRRFPH